MSNFVKIEKPTKEGEESKCVHCGVQLIGRLTDYKGRFPDYLQWQATDERKAHYLKDGGCKGQSNNSDNKPDTNPNPTQNLELDQIKTLIEQTHAMMSEMYGEFKQRQGQF